MAVNAKTYEHKCTKGSKRAKEVGTKSFEKHREKGVKGGSS